MYSVYSVVGHLLLGGGWLGILRVGRSPTLLVVRLREAASGRWPEAADSLLASRFAGEMNFAVRCGGGAGTGGSVKIVGPRGVLGLGVRQRLDVGDEYRRLVALGALEDAVG